MQSTILADIERLWSSQVMYMSLIVITLHKNNMCWSINRKWSSLCGFVEALKQQVWSSTMKTAGKQNNNSANNKHKKC